VPNIFTLVIHILLEDITKRYFDFKIGFYFYIPSEVDKKINVVLKYDYGSSLSLQSRGPRTTGKQDRQNSCVFL
jgi:hypothetical protein